MCACIGDAASHWLAYVHVPLMQGDVWEGSWYYNPILDCAVYYTHLKCLERDHKVQVVHLEKHG
jgi:hypothetical protein